MGDRGARANSTATPPGQQGKNDKNKSGVDAQSLGNTFKNTNALSLRAKRSNLSLKNLNSLDCLRLLQPAFGRLRNDTSCDFVQKLPNY